MMHMSITTGAFPIVALILGVAAFLFLLIRSDRRWWQRSVPISVGVALLLTVALALFTNEVWHPFADPVPLTALVWIGLAIGGLILAVLRPVRWFLRAACALFVVVIALAGAVQLNAQFGDYPTLSSALGVAQADEVPATQALTPDNDLVTAPGTEPLADVWTRPADLPAAGHVTTVSIPGAVSGFQAREAMIYLPPAYEVKLRAELPVLVMMAGQPGEPADWFNGPALATTMDTYAAAHDGLAPVVVVADNLGSSAANPMCVDSESAGHAFTYLTVDVRNWIMTNLQVNKDPSAWAVGGLSEGATCAVQIAVRLPKLFPTFLAFACEDEPTISSHQDTVNQLFNGDEAAFDKINPVSILATQKFPTSAGYLTAGVSDDVYGPQTQKIYQSAQAAGMDVQFTQVPGGHDFRAWGAGLSASMNWLGTRLKITS